MRLHVLVDDLAVARQAVAEGATVVQLRLKGAATDVVVERGRPFRDLDAPLVVNDDVEAALRLGATGVHLGQDDEGFERAREEGLLLGISVSREEEVEDAVARGADYLGAGPVWGTPTKPDAAPATGLEGLGRIARASSVPVVAIGGIDAGNAALCIEAGAAGIAVVRAAREAGELRRVVDAALKAGG